MKLFLSQICLILLTTIHAQETKVDVLLEKIQKSQTKKDKQTLMTQLKFELAKINKKARDESDAIIKAKKKLPSTFFNEKNMEK